LKVGIIGKERKGKGKVGWLRDWHLGFPPKGNLKRATNSFKGPLGFLFPRD